MIIDGVKSKAQTDLCDWLVRSFKIDGSRKPKHLEYTQTHTDRGVNQWDGT